MKMVYQFRTGDDEPNYWQQLMFDAGCMSYDDLADAEASQKVGPVRDLLNGQPWLPIWCDTCSVSMEELALRTGIPIEQLHMMEGLVSLPDRHMLNVIANGLGVTPEFILRFRPDTPNA